MASSRSSKDTRPETSEVIVLCECCQKQKTSFFCEDHSVVICHFCKSTKHRKCKTASVKHKSESYEETKLISTTREANTLQEEINKITDECKSEAHDLSCSKVECINDIKQFRSQVDKLMDELEEKSYTSLTQLESVEKEEIESRLSVCYNLQHMIHEDKTLLESATSSVDRQSKFAADTKISHRLKEYASLIQEIQGEKKHSIITFKRDKHLDETMNSFKSLGTFVNSTNRMNNINVLAMKIQTLNEVESASLKLETHFWITGCMFMPSGQVLLCDRYHGILRLDTALVLEARLDLEQPFCLSLLNETIAVVTLPDSQELVFVEVLPRFKKTRIMKLDKGCWGIDIVRESIYLTLFHGDYQTAQDAEIRVLDTGGNLKRRIHIGKDDFSGGRFFSPKYIKVSHMTGSIYLSDMGTHIFTCLSADGSLVYQYKDEDLREPGGILLDVNDNVLVLSVKRKIIQVLKATGVKHDSIECNVTYPHTLASRHSDNTLLIGGYAQTFALYKIE